MPFDGKLSLFAPRDRRAREEECRVERDVSDTLLRAAPTFPIFACKGLVLSKDVIELVHIYIHRLIFSYSLLHSLVAFIA